MSKPIKVWALESYGFDNIAEIYSDGYSCVQVEIKEVSYD